MPEHGNVTDANATEPYDTAVKESLFFYDYTLLCRQLERPPTDVDVVVLSVRKPEVQSIASLICSCSKIFDLFLHSERVPFLVSLLVAPCIIDLAEDVQNDVQYTYSYQHTIAATIWK